LIGKPPITPKRLDQLKKNLPKGSVIRRSRVTLGVTSDRRYHPNVRIDDVQPDTAADDAGIEPGDIILAADKTKTTDFQSLLDFLLDVSPGQTVQFKIDRDGKTLTLPAKLRGWEPLK